MRCTRVATEEHVVFKSDEGVKEEKRLTDFAEVRLELEQRIEERASGKKKTSREEIQIEIFSPFFIHELQIIDLPGFNNESNTAEEIVDMNLSYMKNEDNIILVVKNATNNIDDEALDLSMTDDVDPEGERTIGVVTKIDQVTTALEKQQLSNILSNKAKPLKHGYIGVANRPTELDDTKSARRRSNTNGKMKIFRSNTMQQQKEMRRGGRPTVQNETVGLELLQRRITKIHTSRIGSLLSTLREEKEGEVKWIKEEIQRLGVDEESNVDDLTAKLIEMAINRVKISLKGVNKKMDSHKVLTGFSFSDVLKMEAIAASKGAQTKHSQQDFYERVLLSLKKEGRTREKLTPDKNILEMGVSVLTENYRIPFKNLLDDFVSNLTRTIINDLETTLGSFPHFKDLVQSVILEDLDRNKVKTEEYLDLQVDIHKHFIEEDSFSFSAQHFNKSCKSLQDLSVDRESTWKKSHHCLSLETLDEYEDNSTCDSLSHLSSDFGKPTLLSGNKKRGFGTRVASAVHGLRLKIGKEDEERGFSPSFNERSAMVHLQLCLDYMRSVEKTLVTDVPKIFIMMLVVKTVDFLNGGMYFSQTIKNDFCSECTWRSLLVICSAGGAEENSRDRSKGKVSVSILIILLFLISTHLVLKAGGTK